MTETDVKKKQKYSTKVPKIVTFFHEVFVPCLFHMAPWLIKKGVAKAMGAEAGQRFIGAFRQEGKNKLIGIF